MAIKTISLELDAYEKLRREKRGKESFSQVVRRARFDAEESTGAAILEETAALYAANKGAGAKSLKYFEKVAVEDKASPRISSSHWER
jgi:hypothetical protein